MDAGVMTMFELVVLPARSRPWLGPHSAPADSRGVPIRRASFFPAELLQNGGENPGADVAAFHALKKSEGVLAKEYVILRHGLTQSMEQEPTRNRGMQALSSAQLDTPKTSEGRVESRSRGGSSSSLVCEDPLSSRKNSGSAKRRVSCSRRQTSALAESEPQVAAILRGANSGSHYLLASCAPKVTSSPPMAETQVEVSDSAGAPAGSPDTKSCSPVFQEHPGDLEQEGKGEEGASNEEEPLVTPSRLVMTLLGSKRVQSPAVKGSKVIQRLWNGDSRGDVSPGSSDGEEADDSRRRGWKSRKRFRALNEQAAVVVKGSAELANVGAGLIPAGGLPEKKTQGLLQLASPQVDLPPLTSGGVLPNASHSTFAAAALGADYVDEADAAEPGVLTLGTGSWGVWASGLFARGFARDSREDASSPLLFTAGRGADRTEHPAHVAARKGGGGALARRWGSAAHLGLSNPPPLDPCQPAAPATRSWASNDGKSTPVGRGSNSKPGVNAQKRSSDVLLGALDAGSERDGSGVFAEGDVEDDVIRQPSCLPLFLSMPLDLSLLGRLPRLRGRGVQRLRPTLSADSWPGERADSGRTISSDRGASGDLEAPPGFLDSSSGRSTPSDNSSECGARRQCGTQSASTATPSASASASAISASASPSAAASAAASGPLAGMALVCRRDASLLWASRSSRRARFGCSQGQQKEQPRLVGTPDLAIRFYHPGATRSLLPVPRVSRCMGPEEGYKPLVEVATDDRDGWVMEGIPACSFQTVAQGRHRVNTQGGATSGSADQPASSFIDRSLAEPLLELHFPPVGASQESFLGGPRSDVAASSESSNSKNSATSSTGVSSKQCILSMAASSGSYQPALQMFGTISPKVRALSFRVLVDQSQMSALQAFAFCLARLDSGVASTKLGAC